MIRGGGNNQKESWLTEAALTDEELPLMDEGQSTEDITSISQGSDSAIYSLTDTKKDTLSEKSSITPSTTMNISKNVLLKNDSKRDLSKMKANIDELDEFLTMNDNSNDVNREQSFENMNCDSVVTNTTKCEKNDGNDTDELLRMLGGDDDKKKKVFSKSVKKNNVKNDESTDDELEAGIQKYKISKNVANTKKDSVKTVKPNTNSLLKSVTNNNKSKAKETKLIPLHVSKNSKEVKKRHVFSSPIKVKNFSENISLRKSSPIKTYVPKHKKEDSKNNSVNNIEKADDSCDEDIREEEFLDDDCFDLEYEQNSGLLEESDEEIEKQIRRTPEKMDEEIPSDQESRDSELSCYGELPSSDSSDVDEWFELDIRHEMAAEYVPLLGDDAQSILNEEKERVSKKLISLKQDLNDITSDVKLQLARIEDSRLKLIEVDALLNEK